MKLPLALLAALALANALPAQEPALDPWISVEQGALKLFYHTYRVGSIADGNDDFDFVNQGGQEILFPFQRLTVGLVLFGVHDVSFLYQPLEIATQTRFREDVTIDGITFASGSPMALTYSFPFYRVTYQYRFLSDGSGSFLAGGLALQLRNASIRFVEIDGSQSSVSQNLGLVPALALSGRLEFGGGLWAAFEATGIYASSALINGATFSFEGSILDASLRFGMPLTEWADIFLNVRYFGGSAAGVSGYERLQWTNSTSAETANYISAASVTIGVTLR
jgi:hypothetical protein